MPELTRLQIRDEVRGYLLNTDAAQAGWTDAELNSYIDEGCFYIQQLTNSYQDIAIMETVASQADYSLPDNCYQLIRVAFDRQFLPQTTEYELDRDTSSAWRGDPTGTPCRFYLKQYNQVSLYQIPRTSGSSYTASQELGELVKIDSTFSFSSEFGVVTQLLNTSGASVNLFRPDPLNRFNNPDYGIVIDYQDSTQNLEFMYVAQTDTMADDGQSPQFQDTFHPAVIYYTLMRCFLRDGEFQDLAAGQAWYQTFLDWMDAALSAGAKEFPTQVKSLEPFGTGNILNGRLVAVGPPSQMIVIGTP
jgi:hypothetical protein